MDENVRKVFEGFKDTFNELYAECEMTLKEFSEKFDLSEYVVLRWKNSAGDKKLKSLIKTADFFNCSVEYLCGKTNTRLDYVPKECPEISEWLPQVMKKNGVTSYKLFRDTEIRPAHYYYWLKGYAAPMLGSLEIMAQYLDVTLDHLIGRDRS